VRAQYELPVVELRELDEVSAIEVGERPPPLRKLSPDDHERGSGKRRDRDPSLAIRSSASRFRTRSDPLRERAVELLRIEQPVGGSNIGIESLRLAGRTALEKDDAVRLNLTAACKATRPPMLQPQKTTACGSSWAWHTATAAKSDIELLATSRPP
jgi:hypothetical protein